MNQHDTFPDVSALSLAATLAAILEDDAYEPAETSEPDDCELIAMED